MLNSPLPPVLALKVTGCGGGPAGVVEELPLSHAGLEIAAGVVDPNKDGADVLGVAVIPGDAGGCVLPNPPKGDFDDSAPLFSCDLTPNEKPDPV